MFKAEMPSTSLGKSCARIKYKEQDALNLMMHIIKEVIQMHRDIRKDNIYDISAIKNGRLFLNMEEIY
ncbi:hypothetical protein [Cellulosilyticum sp. I15G10I2]|uniref:hypothetical protein n=1 Tax=Cellulosilyticum sp. I15G10I2 TaxID=1892843 RepID=UPI00085BFA07|nr:hypothetical protein [Cellulosilyticum sp. I15G10I2]